MVLVLTFMLFTLTNPSTFITALPPLPAAVPLLQAAERTPIEPSELLKVLRRAHVEVFGAEPSTNRLAVAWAQIAFENGRGKEVFNFNLGNIGPGAKHRRILLRDGGYYRAFTSFDEAALTYWTHLKEHCPTALLGFSSLNALYISERLRACGYHRTDVTRYGQGISGLIYAALRL